MTRSLHEERNLQHVIDMFCNVLVPLDSNRIGDYISPDYIQLSQMATPGVASLKAFLDEKRAESAEAKQQLKRAFVDGGCVEIR